jgi:hypothetical protein
MPVPLSGLSKSSFQLSKVPRNEQPVRNETLDRKNRMANLEDWPGASLPLFRVQFIKGGNDEL